MILVIGRTTRYNPKRMVHMTNTVQMYTTTFCGRTLLEPLTIEEHSETMTNGVTTNRCARCWHLRKKAEKR